jgi:hypothetical protein
MNLTEDRLRVALRETGEEIGPGRVPRLELPAGRERGAGHRESSRAGHRASGRAGGRWLPALAAAAAVIAIVATSVALAGGPRPRPASPLAQLPAYYVALQQLPDCQCNPLVVNSPKGYISNPDRAVVRSTMTGATLATIAVPRPYGSFLSVQAAGDDRTFILAAQQLTFVGLEYPATRFYRLRVNPSAPPGHRAVLTALAIPPVPRGYAPGGIALSPDGRELAVISQRFPGPYTPTLRVSDLSKGTHRTWSLPPATVYIQLRLPGSPALSWAPDSRTLGVLCARAAIALLDTAAPGRSFRADATMVPLHSSPGTRVEYGLLTPDGRHILEIIANLRAIQHAHSFDPAAFELSVLSLPGDTVTPLRRGLTYAGVQWSDPSGSAVVVMAGQPSFGHQIPAFLWTARRTLPLVLPPVTLGVAW